MKVYIDVKSITGGYDKDSETSEDVAKIVNIEIKVGDVTKYTDSNVDKNNSNKEASISAKEGQEVKVIITDSKGGSWTRSQTISSTTGNSISFK